jgi:hypothetical protein
MLTVASLACALSVLWTAFIIFANGMSCAPSVPFTGMGSIAACWVVTAGLFLAWAVM